MIILQGGPCDFKTTVQSLLEEHWQEVAKNKELMVLAPDWERYQALHAAGMMFTLYAWDDDYNLLGYSCNILDRHMHYKGLTVASNDVLFVSKAHRASSVGLRLMAATKAAAKVHGAQLMLWHAKADSALDRILKAKRLAVQDIIYSETL